MEVIGSRISNLQGYARMNEKALPSARGSLRTIDLVDNKGVTLHAVVESTGKVLAATSDKARVKGMIRTVLDAYNAK